MTATMATASVAMPLPGLSSSANAARPAAVHKITAKKWVNCAD